MPLPFDALDDDLAEAVREFQERFDRDALDRGVKAIKSLIAHAEWGTQPAERRCGLLSQGSGLLLQRFKVRGEVGDLKHAIDLLRIASDDLAPSDAVLGSILGNLGVALRNSAEQFNDPDALDEAIEVQRRACALPGDALARWGRTLNLAMALFARLEIRGSAGDVDEMRALLDTAYESAPTRDRAAQTASNRAILERLLFELGGDPLDLERAATFAEAAVARTPPGHPERASRLNNFGICLGARLSIYGRREDGHRAIAALKEARETVPTSHVEAATRAMNLGSAHLTMFQIGHDRADLEAATAALEDAVTGLPSDHAYLGQVLTALSQGLTTQALLDDDRQMLDRSVATALQAVAATDLVPKARPSALTAAAIALLERSRLGGHAGDRKACFAACEEALSLTSPKSLENLNLQMVRLRVRALDAHLDGERSAMSELVQEGCVALGEMGRRIASAGTMAGLGERLAATRRELVSYALSSGDPSGALAMIETGKAYALLRDVRRAERIPAGLADREIEEYRAAAKRLRILDALLAGTTTAIGPNSRSDHAAEISSLSQRIEQLERHDPLFATDGAIGFGAIRGVAERSGSVLVYLVVGQDGPGTALIVRPEWGAQSGLEVVPLPDLNEGSLSDVLAPFPMDVGRAKRCLSAGPDAAFEELGWETGYRACRIADLSVDERRTAEEVWLRRVVATVDWLNDVVMAPLSRHMPSRSTSRLRWILLPDGRLSGLPIHACDAIRNRGIPISYAPSASVLDLLLDRAAAAEQDAIGSTTALLLADPEDASGFGAVEALRIADAFVRAGAHVRRGRGLSWLRAAAAGGDEIIICAHGEFDAADVYRSTIDLGAGGSDRLSLAALYGGAIALKSGASILLSSCETSKSDTRLHADEQLGFPSGFFLAGARFVAASLWSMSSLAAFMFSVEYVECRLSGQDRAASIQHAAGTLREMTRDGLVSRLQEALRHAGRRTELRRELRSAADQAASGPERPFSHPVHWACFAANGL